MEVGDLPILGLKLIVPRVFADQRGYFYESYNAEKLRLAGISTAFVQDNQSHSQKGVLRGLHLQTQPGQAKLIRVVEGRIFDVAVDVRRDSPTFGKWHGLFLDSEKKEQFFIPVGFAHGFCVMSSAATVLYKTSSVYDGKTEAGFRWDDKDINIVWPMAQPIVSQRDQDAPTFKQFCERFAWAMH